MALLSNPPIAIVLGTALGMFFAWLLMYAGRPRSNEEAQWRFALAFVVILGELLAAFVVLLLYRAVAPGGLATFGAGLAIGQTVGLIWMSYVVTRRS